LAGILSAQQLKLGSKVTDFNVQDLDGEPVPFSALHGPVTVVTFIATQCPVSNYWCKN
jgi:cytochrome oxidase Cu insertion factor (SCO1/SenC/PrrC family)